MKKRNRMPAYIALGVLAVIVLMAMQLTFTESYEAEGFSISEFITAFAKNVKNVVTNPISSVKEIYNTTIERIREGLGAFKGKPKVECTVTVDADIFSDTDLLDDSCRRTGKSCLGINPLAAFSDKGNIEFATEDESGKESFKSSRVPLFGKTTVQETLCTNASFVFITVFSGEGDVVAATETTITGAAQ